MVPASAQSVEVVAVEGQPLAANVQRMLQSLTFLGAPLENSVLEDLMPALAAEDVSAIQECLDGSVLYQWAPRRRDGNSGRLPDGLDERAGRLAKSGSGQRIIVEGLFKP